MIPTRSYAKTAIAIGTGLTDLAVFDDANPGADHLFALRGQYSLCSVELKNSHASAHWDQFRVLAKYHASGGWVTLLDTGDYAATDNLLLWVSTPPDALEDGVTAVLNLFLGCPYALKFQAAGASASTGEIRAMLSA